MVVSWMTRVWTPSQVFYGLHPYSMHKLANGTSFKFIEGNVTRFTHKVTLKNLRSRMSYSKLNEPDFFHRVLNFFQCIMLAALKVAILQFSGSKHSQRIFGHLKLPSLVTWVPKMQFRCLTYKRKYTKINWMHWYMLEILLMTWEIFKDSKVISSWRRLKVLLHMCLTWLAQAIMNMPMNTMNTVIDFLCHTTIEETLWTCITVFPLVQYILYLWIQRCTTNMAEI